MLNTFENTINSLQITIGLVILKLLKLCLPYMYVFLPKKTSI